MAPAVAAKGNRRPDAGAAPVPMSGGEDPEQSKKMLAALAKAQGAFLKNADYVGSRFADEARAMHLGETDHRTIYGETPPDEEISLIYWKRVVNGKRIRFRVDRGCSGITIK